MTDDVNCVDASPAIQNLGHLLDAITMGIKNVDLTRVPGQVTGDIGRNRINKNDLLPLWFCNRPGTLHGGRF